MICSSFSCVRGQWKVIKSFKNSIKNFSTVLHEEKISKLIFQFITTLPASPLVLSQNIHILVYKKINKGMSIMQLTNNTGVSIFMWHTSPILFYFSWVLAFLHFHWFHFGVHSLYSNMLFLSFMLN